MKHKKHIVRGIAAAMVLGCAALAWFTDFVGFVPMPEGGAHEAFLAADYNAEMIEHIERHPGVRDRAIFVGNPDDIVPLSFGKDLPAMRDWVPRHFEFSGYVLGQHPQAFGPREALRRRLGYRGDERVCIITVGFLCPTDLSGWRPRACSPTLLKRRRASVVAAITT